MVDDGDTDGTWAPLPLPDDDELARDPDLDELERAFADASVGALAPPSAELAMQGATGPAVPPEPDAEANGAAASSASTASSEAAADDDESAAVPPDVLLRPGVAVSDKQASWTKVFVGGVVLVFCMFAPLRVLGGGILLWTVTYLLGAVLAIVGGLVTGKALTTRGSARLGPLIALVSGIIVIVACAVVAVIGAQGDGG